MLGKGTLAESIISYLTGFSPLRIANAQRDLTMLECECNVAEKRASNNAQMCDNAYNVDVKMCIPQLSDLEEQSLLG